MTRPLAVWPCRAECAWSTSGERLAGELLSACAGCGSEWVASEAWTPIDHRGEVPEAVLAERRGGPAR